jgi:protein transport protein SEC23
VRTCGAVLQVMTSRDVKVSGLLGPAAPVEKKSVSVAEQSVGYGGTTLWKLAGLVSFTRTIDELVHLFHP